MLPEVYFLRYAFTCARVLVDFRKTLTEEEYEKMQKAVETDTPMDRKYLEKVFCHAIEGLKKINTDYWNIETIREYFWRRHKEHLSRDLPPTIKRMCLVKPGKLVKRIDDYFRADLGDGDIRTVIPIYKGAKVGDTAMIHYGYAVEKV
ncbi:MAG: HypC/HybG/HupF family hydrogenase formation chaperone [Nanoarchaeota archaeon]|nr:HypC/HybG/HupF family hydrogenase formation chaperone [Nanoarchaeota archaeon]